MYSDAGEHFFNNLWNLDLMKSTGLLTAIKQPPKNLCAILAPN